MDDNKAFVIVICALFIFGGGSLVLNEFFKSQKEIALINAAGANKSFIVKNEKIYRQDIANPKKYCRFNEKNESECIEQ